MKMKSVDINQRIPLDTLQTALVTFLNDNYDEGYILEQLQLDYKGANRLKKSLRIVNKLVPNSPISDFLTENADQLKIALKQKPDRNVILISLLNVSFGFSFDTFDFLTRIFNAQQLVNSDTVLKALSKIYGGNRSTVNAMYSVIPMYVEAEMFNRPKTGVYESNGPIIVSSEISRDIYQNSFWCNKGLVPGNGNFVASPYLDFVRS